MTTSVHFRQGDEGWWRVEVRATTPIRLQARTIQAGTKKAAGQLRVAPRDLIPKYHFSREVTQILRGYHKARAAADELPAIRDQAIQALKGLRLSTRDIGTVLGVSHYVVHQSLQLS